MSRQPSDREALAVGILVVIATAVFLVEVVLATAAIIKIQVEALL
jgi:hypothetical protein